MDITTPFLTAQQLALVPLTIGLVSIVKMTGLTGVDNRFAPILALLVGVGLAFLLPSLTLSFTILAGLVVGCAAAGVYSGVKTSIGA